MNQIKETIKLLQTMSEDQLVELFNDIDCEETALLVYEAANYYLRKKSQEREDEDGEEPCEKDWLEADYAQRLRDIQ